MPLQCQAQAVCTRRGKRARAAAKAERKAAKAANKRRKWERSPSTSSSPPPLTAAEEAATHARNARFGNGSVQGGRTLTAEVGLSSHGLRCAGVPTWRPQCTAQSWLVCLCVGCRQQQQQA